MHDLRAVFFNNTQTVPNLDSTLFPNINLDQNGDHQHSSL